MREFQGADETPDLQARAHRRDRVQGRQFTMHYNQCVTMLGIVHWNSVEVWIYLRVHTLTMNVGHLPPPL